MSLLEKEMATHSSIRGWRTPQTEEPGRLQCMGLQVRHNLALSFSLCLYRGSTPSTWIYQGSLHWTLSCSICPSSSVCLLTMLYSFLASQLFLPNQPPPPGEKEFRIPNSRVTFAGFFPLLDFRSIIPTALSA